MSARLSIWTFREYIQFQHLRRTENFPICIVSGGGKIDLPGRSSYKTTTSEAAVTIGATVVESNVVVCVDPNEGVGATRPHLSSGFDDGTSVFLRKLR